MVGGATTGVEVPGALADLLRTDMKQDYPNLPQDRVQVLLYDGSPHLLGTFKPEHQQYARKELEQRGVKVHTDTHVRNIGRTSIELSTGEKVKIHTLIWAAGLKANPIVQSPVRLLDRQHNGGQRRARSGLQKDREALTARRADYHS